MFKSPLRCPSLYRPSYPFFGVLVLIFFFLNAGVSLGQVFPEGFQGEIIADGLNPTQMVIAPDGRLFVAEKNGTIRVIEEDVLQPQVFLSLDVEEFNERGLLGIVFHPDFESNNFFYVYYTVLGEVFNRVSRFTSNGATAIPASEEILLDLDPLAGSYHNGGVMRVGADNHLYIGVGDGGFSLNSQNPDKLLGKILRMTLDGDIPLDNPYYTEYEGNKRYIYASGYRNPYTMDVHRETGQILINDVGGGEWEEVNELQPHSNYGWSLIEGFLNGETPPDDYKDPLYAYSHSLGCAITGSAFYDPDFSTFPAEYEGVYFFADYCQGYIKSLDPISGFVTGTFSTDLEQPIGLEVSPDGSLYILERYGIGGGATNDNNSSENGRVWKISYTGSGEPYIVEHPQSVVASIGESPVFEVNGGGAGELSYEWMINGVSQGLSDEDEYALMIDMDIPYEVFCILSNSEGSLSSDTAYVEITDNQRPVPTIISPLIESIYSAGQTLSISGSAFDEEDGNIEASGLSWHIDLHHNVHTHPVLSDVSGIDSFDFTIPTVGETSTDVFYRIYLTATDSEGRTQSTYVDVQPQVLNVTLSTNPSIVPLVVEGQLVVETMLIQTVVGVERVVIAPPVHTEGEKLYIFDQWSNGSIDHVLQFQGEQDDLSFVALYDSLILDSGEGLNGSYYNDIDLEIVGEAVATRLDSLIDFNWGLDSPLEDVDADFFGVHWEGYIQPLFDGEHQFFLLGQDGARLMINDEVIVDVWSGLPDTEQSGTIWMNTSQEYKIVVEMREKNFNAAVRLSWKHDLLPYERVRTSQLSIFPFPPRPTDTEPSIYPRSVLFPNPATESVSFFHEKIPLSIRAIDMMGKMHGLEYISSSDRTDVGIEELTSGIYFIEIIYPDGQEWLRMMKD